MKFNWEHKRRVT